MSRKKTDLVGVERGSMVLKWKWRRTLRIIDSVVVLLGMRKGEGNGKCEKNGNLRANDSLLLAPVSSPFLIPNKITEESIIRIVRLQPPLLHNRSSFHPNKACLFFLLLPVIRQSLLFFPN